MFMAFCYFYKFFSFFHNWLHRSPPFKNCRFFLHFCALGLFVASWSEQNMNTCLLVKSLQPLYLCSKLLHFDHIFKFFFFKSVYQVFTTIGLTDPLCRPRVRPDYTAELLFWCAVLRLSYYLMMLWPRFVLWSLVLLVMCTAAINITAEGIRRRQFCNIFNRGEG